MSDAVIAAPVRRLPTLTPEALDFAPDLLAIQDRPPERLPRALLLTIATLVGLLLVWTVFAKLDIIATAEGRLVPQTFTKAIQSAEAGVVTEILVKEGERVKAGQLLIRLDGRISKADTTALSKDVALKQLTLRRIEAELAERVLVPGKNEPADLYAQVESQFRARRHAYLDAVLQETAALNKAKADLVTSQQVLAKLTQTLPSFQQSADAYRRLLQEGFVGELAANEKTREAVEKSQDLQVQTASVQSLDVAITQSERRIAALRSQYRSQLENERMETLAQLNRGEQELEKSHLREQSMDIIAPTDGVVKDLTPTTRGAVVAAGALLMNIVPQGEPLQAEVLLKNEDVGFVAVGQMVRLKVAAYPFQKYGLLDGTVAMVGADSTDPKLPQPQGQPPTLTYRAMVQADAHHLVSAASGEKLPLNPGMLITAEIHQGERSVIEYLLSPVKKVTQEAARER